MCIVGSHLFLFPLQGLWFCFGILLQWRFLTPSSMMDGIGLDLFKHSLILGNFGDVCVSLQYCRHKEHISADL